MLTPNQLSDFSVALKKLFNLSEDHDLSVTVLKMNSKVAHFRLDLPIPSFQLLLFKDLYVSVDMEPPKDLELTLMELKVTKSASPVKVSYWWSHCEGGRNGHYLNQFSHFLWDTKEFW